MHRARLHFALPRRCFGRGPAWIVEPAPAPFQSSLSEEFKLFAATFVGGFLFMSLLLA